MPPSRPRPATVAAAIWKTRHAHLALRMAAGRLQHHTLLEAWREAREEEAKILSRYLPELDSSVARGPLARDMQWGEYENEND